MSWLILIYRRETQKCDAGNSCIALFRQSLVPKVIFNPMGPLMFILFCWRIVRFSIPESLGYRTEALKDYQKLLKCLQVS